MIDALFAGIGFAFHVCLLCAGLGLIVIAGRMGR